MPTLRVSLLNGAKLGVVALGVLALSATGAPYNYTPVEDSGHVSVLTQDLPELRYRITVCGGKPYTGGGGLFRAPERSEIHIFVDESDAETRIEFRRTELTDNKLMEPVTESKKVFDLRLRLERGPGGAYCDVQTELTVATGAAPANVRWHVEVDYLADMDGSESTSPTISVEPVP